MELEELKELWTQSTRRLEASMRLNTLLLQQANLRKASGLLGRFSRGLVIELLVNFVGVVLLGSFAADHVREAPFFIPAVALAIYAIGLLIASVRQILEIHAVDYDEPVVAIQRKLEQLRLRRIRTTLATLLFAPLMWVPLLVVVLRAFGIDVYALTSATWLAANVAFGFAVIPLAVFVARRYGRQLGQSTLMRSLADEIAGVSLVSALNSLDTIRHFEEETLQ
jgi:hypothetical protein